MNKGKNMINRIKLIILTTIISFSFTGCLTLFLSPFMQNQKTKDRYKVKVPNYRENYYLQLKKEKRMYGEKK